MDDFRKKGLLILHLNVNSLLPKTDDIIYIAKQSNASIIEIGESKLDLSFLNNRLDIENYNLISIDRSRRGGGVAYYIKKFLSYSNEPNFCGDIERVFIDIFLPKSKPILVEVLCQPPNKPEFIEHLDKSLKENSIGNIQDFKFSNS